MYREIDTTIFEKILTTTPPAITPEIAAWCRDITPRQTPLYVDHQPSPESEVRECFNNVRRHSALHGGELVYGWAIWEWTDVFIEAEHHAVWQSPTGLIDISPHECRTDGILFLPDPDAPYDYINFTRRDNVRRSLSTNPSVQAWLDESAALARVLESHSVGKEYRMSQAQFAQLEARGRRIEQLKGDIYFDLARRSGVNSPCFCRSGKKFKKCCSRYFR